MLSDHRFPNFSALQSLDSIWSSKHPSYCSGSGWAGLGLACWHGWGVLKLKRICNERHLVWLYVACGTVARRRAVYISCHPALGVNFPLKRYQSGRQRTVTVPYIILSLPSCFCFPMLMFTLSPAEATFIKLLWKLCRPIRPMLLLLYTPTSWAAATTAK